MEKTNSRMKLFLYLAPEMGVKLLPQLKSEDLFKTQKMFIMTYLIKYGGLDFK